MGRMWFLPPGESSRKALTGWLLSNIPAVEVAYPFVTVSSRKPAWFGPFGLVNSTRT